ncbi:uncharacterized protein LOC124789607 [Schistocerca piceifrons]|uniref:uncharacterized protein LOC124789607 n=1 Tax=Schistocerca piceifrons TaxID=274613 RepID=UPI001F5FADF3|nr:uncharacterized protein LOC124789607 [Schistocerca piceifrons]
MEGTNSALRRPVWLLLVLLSPALRADVAGSTAATSPSSVATPAAAATVASLLLPRHARQFPLSSVNQIPSGDDTLSAAPSTPRKAINKGCTGAQRFTLTCLKLDVAALVERMSSAREYQLMPGVSVVRTNGSDGDGAAAEGTTSTPDLVASVARDFPHDSEARVDAYLARRVARYLQTHAISVKLLDADSLAAARQLSHEVFGLPAAEGSQETGRKGGGGLGGKKGGGGQLLLMMMMMKAMMGAGAGGLLFLLAGKALITALLALMLAAIVGLKSLAGGGGGKSVTYEIVSKPVYSHEHTHSSEVQHGHGYGHSSYGRSFSVDPVEAINKSATEYDSTGDSSYVPGGMPYYSSNSDAQPMAYRAYSSIVDNTRGA